MKKITVLISGGGTNLQSIIDRVENGFIDAKINYVIADRQAYGLERAKRHNIKNILIDRKLGRIKWTERFLSRMQEEKPDLIVLAGFLSIIDKQIIEQFPKKIINIHPALLPKFGGKGMYGINVHRAVIEAGEKESGCTVHYVDTGVDTGKIIIQRKVMVLPDDTPERLQKRVLEQEHLALSEAIRMVLNSRKS
jgi:phosphoribosylglycinamide formyltransferase-1